MKQVLLTICAVICMCVTILSSGIMLCMNVPQVTQNLSRATSMVDKAHFTRDQLVFMADKTRAYVAGEIDKAEIYSAVHQINIEQKSPYADYEDLDFAAVPDDFSLDQNSLKHLEDVRSFFANLKIAFGLCAAGSLIFSVLLLVLCGRSTMGRAFCWASGIILISMALFGVWAIIDFNGMFNWMHSLFFANGSWLFSMTSLLICMYPEAFWVGMGAICFACSAIISLILLFVGRFVK